ncbi:CHAT domain-containing protein [Bernardetia sp.]|uniref:CHAT domain-containing protein n=1 Tax=Bernardetia sp. TaxID=1937974 RepID=UPI0025B7F1CA|nr:CHAT domain-containing tetratricopeptide repeat protein [Bernardetia sp.]
MNNSYLTFLLYFILFSSVSAQNSSINYSEEENTDSLAWNMLLDEANYQQSRYDYKNAIQTYQNLLEQTKNKDSIYFFDVKNQLANLYQQKGNYAEAEILLSQCLDFNKNKFGENSLEYAQVCNDLAVVSRFEGNYRKAEFLHLKAKENQEKELTKLSIPYATSCLNLAELYRIGNRYDKSERYLMEANNILGNILGRKHPDYAKSLVGLADYHTYKNRFGMAETALEKARQIYAENYSKQNLDYANTCVSLANLYTLQDNYQKGLSLFKEVEYIYNSLLGKNHPDYVFFLNSYAVFYQKYGFYDKAQPLFIRVIEIKLQELQNNFYSLSEKEKLSYIQSNDVYFDNFAAFFVHIMTEKPDYRGFTQLLEAMINIQMARKGILLSENQRIQKAILSSKNSKLIEKYEEWKQIKHQIALGNNLDLAKRKELNLNLEELKNTANGLEKQISALSKRDDFLSSHQMNLENYTLANLQNSLDENETAVEIVTTGKGKDKTYIAIIVKKNKVTPVIIENIDEAGDLAYYRNTIQFQLENTESYYKLWYPLQREIGWVKRLYFSADGIYNFINPYTFYNPNTGKYITKEWILHSITSLREVIDKKQNSLTDKEKTAVLMGRPNYLSTKDKENNDETNLGEALQLSTEIFTDLEQTEYEIKKIDSLLKKTSWKTEIFLKSNASEETLKQVFHPTVLHIATHGYFEKTNNQNPLNSMLGAGIVLAQPKDNNQAEDGIFTAYEASLLDLQKTELVVISACETGLGQIASQEGVYGLQRGFRAAGARNVLLSLWQVDDKATQELMTIFYKEWFEGKTKQEALRNAQNQMRQKYEHPYYWGAFVLAGE